MESLITLKQLTKSYHIGEQVQPVLKGVDLDVKKGDLLSIMGQSGSGKSTLMNILGLLDKQDSGTFSFEGRDIKSLTEDELAAIRNLKVGFVFQSFFLLPRLNALTNVQLPLLYRDTPKNEMQDRAMAMLERVGMADWWHHKPKELSGGQQQRVAIARALVGDPEIVLADEPTGALDPRIGKEVLELFIELNQASGKTLVIITHDPEVAEQCQRCVHMVDGYLKNEVR